MPRPWSDLQQMQQSQPLTKVCRSSNRASSSQNNANHQSTSSYNRTDKTLVRTISNTPTDICDAPRDVCDDAPPDRYTVNLEEYAEFLRYKNMQSFECMHLKSPSRRDEGPRADAQLCGSRISFLVDTGSPINVIDQSRYLNLPTRPTLSPARRSFMDSRQPLP